MITKFQIAAARALLEWTQDDLAQASGVSKDMISKIEGGKSAGSLKSIQSIEDALTVAGIEFSENDGVKRSSAQIRVLKGQKGFLEFYDEVFEEVRKTGSTSVQVSNVDERKFVVDQEKQRIRGVKTQTSFRQCVEKLQNDIQIMEQSGFFLQ